MCLRVLLGFRLRTLHHLRQSYAHRLMAEAAFWPSTATKSQISALVSIDNSHIVEGARTYNLGINS